MINILAFITSFIKISKYFGVFIGTFIEGPTVGMLTGSLARLGYLNIYLGYLVYVIGDFTADCLYYAIGYHGGTGLLKKLTFSSKTLAKVKKSMIFFNNHSNKIIFFGKLTHFLGLPILIGAGLAHYSWRKFLVLDLIATLIKSAVIISIGFYLTSFWVGIDNAINYVGLTITFLATILLVYFLIKLSNKKRKLP